MLLCADAVLVESWLKFYVASRVPEVNNLAEKSTTMLHVAPEVPSKYPQTEDWSMTPRITLNKGVNRANDVVFENTTREVSPFPPLLEHVSIAVR